ncbi:MAG: UDP-3-O-(3-hydroxymyristoyl)glucosamine N-acyltransferase [Cyanobacteria bacterium P01_H01_bin.121]
MASQLAANPDLQAVAALDAASEGSISFVDKDLALAQQVITTGASALILPPDASLQDEATKRAIAWVSVSEPRLAFAQAIGLFYQPTRPQTGIHPTAVIDATAELGAGVAIGAHVVIEAHAKIGSGVWIHPNVTIYPEAQVGDRTILHANCVIHERSQIGADCVIHSGVVIGAEGFGFVPTVQGWVKIPQSGYTVLEDQVEVGCNSAIDRPTVGETRIERNTKIDNLVHVGHGCQVGASCAIAAQVGLAGGVQLGKGVILAGQVGIANRVKVGDGAIASSKSGLHRDVEAGEVVSGYPAVANRLWLKASAVYNRLPELYKSIQRLQRQRQSSD